MKINKYPDGTSYVTIPEDWEDTTQEITFRVNTYEDVVHLVQLCDVLIHNRVDAHILIPCLIDAQADKRFGDFNSSGLKVIARILDPYIDGYSISLGVFHPHNPLVVEALFTGVDIVSNGKFIQEVLKDLDRTKPFDGILMSADAGGFKPLIDTCTEIGWQGETYSASKARLSSAFGSKLVQQIDRQDFGGKDILIIDDISVYGGTFKGIAKMLKERNCGNLYLAISHMTSYNLGDDPVTNYFNTVFTTNSKYDMYGVANKDGQPDQPKNLTVIKMFE
jgi:ribose-phosphate pyrophosphokinase